MTTAIPFFGFEPFVLGRNREQLKAAAGAPESISQEEFLEGAQQESWHYPSAGVELDFAKEDGWRLGSITIDSPEIDIRGTRFIGMEERQLLKAAAAAGITDLAQTGDYEENGRCYESDAFGLMVWALNGTVYNLTLFPRYDESGEHPVWPAEGAAGN